jgi:sec-independent protein translocase protein TatA
MTGLTSPLHLAILFLIVLLVFGAKRLPEIGRSLGSGMREFKDSVSGDHDSSPEHGTVHEQHAHTALPSGTTTQDPSASAPRENQTVR